jgi:hypothetical protein
MRLELKHPVNSEPTHLARRKTVSLHVRKGQGIECRSGQLWITQDGDPRDMILEAERSFMFDRNGQALVSALEDACFVVRNAVAPKPASPALPSVRGTQAAGCAY